MQNLRDQLLKAKVIDRKTKKKADQTAKTAKRKKGHRTIAAEEEQRTQAFEERRESQRAEDRRREERRQKKQLAAEKRYRLRDIVERGIIHEGRRGRRRFHFVARTGRIPYFEVAEEVAAQLERGSAAVVEMPMATPGTHEVVTAAAAGELAKSDREAVRFWNRA